MPEAKQLRQTILVADDDDEMREVVAATLTGEGYRVWQAADGQELLDALIDRSRAGAGPDLVVSDVAMPRMSGPDACKATRAAGVAIPFIFMTAFVSEGGREAAERVGAEAVLDKPFDMEDLVAAVRSLLDGADG